VGPSRETVKVKGDPDCSEREAGEASMRTMGRAEGEGVGEGAAEIEGETDRDAVTEPVGVLDGGAGLEVAEREGEGEGDEERLGDTL